MEQGQPVGQTNAGGRLPNKICQRFGAGVGQSERLFLLLLQNHWRTHRLNYKLETTALHYHPAMPHCPPRQSFLSLGGIQVCHPTFRIYLHVVAPRTQSLARDRGIRSAVDSDSYKLCADGRDPFAELSVDAVPARFEQSEFSGSSNDKFRDDCLEPLFHEHGQPWQRQGRCG